MTENPIVEEIRQIREEILAEYGGDFDLYLSDMRKRTEESAKAGRVVVSLPPRPVKQAQHPTRKVG